ncbi:MAG TPA: hypothetical protein VGZ23_05535 [bacterium]|nr:hypothetical protein [bacterium]
MALAGGQRTLQERALKRWTMVEAFGTQNNFDLVARDLAGATLALELKWLGLSSRGPNAEFQRFIGQCTLGSIPL